LKRRQSYITGAVIIAVVAYYSWWMFWSGDNFRLHSANAGNRAGILRLYLAVGLGDDPGKVLQTYWSLRTEDLRLDVDSPGRWSVTMPGEFGASDWTLVLEFRDGRVSAVRVRTADGPQPSEAPRDKGGV
jgi:hypothetical protein